MDMLKGWHDFFVVLGAAAGTLIGAMFVVVSIGSGLVRQENLASRIFVTPTIVHLAVVLMACAFVLVPSLNQMVLGATAGVAGIAFLGYAARNVFHIHRRNEVEWSDHLWYGFLPVIGYLVMIGGAVLLLKASPGAVETIAFGLAVQVISGIRNAWDLILFFLQKRSADGTGPVA
jgi:hypothetical protein